MHGFRVSRVGWDIDSIAWPQKQLIAVHVHDQVALKNNSNFVKRMSVIFDVRMRRQRFQLRSKPLVDEKHLQLLRRGK